MARNRTILAALYAIALAACGPSGPTSPPTLQSDTTPGGCSAEAQTAWTPARGLNFTIRGEAVGVSCEAARATVTVTDAAGRTLHRDTHDVAALRNTIFASANSPDTMRAALAQWIDPVNNTTMLTTGALPEWPAGAAQPANAEFPFYPEANITRETYARLRTENRPLLCYVQGSESMACLALDARGEALTKIGLQTFPG
jgi:hypothetical protein